MSVDDRNSVALARTASVAKDADGEDILMPDIEAMKRAKEMRELEPDSNLVQLILATGDLVIAFFKMVMASMLSVFIPQACPNDSDGK